MAYQKQRDKVADQQWQKEYDLAKKAKRTSSGSCGNSKFGSSTSSNGNSSGSINVKDLETTSANVASNANSKASSSVKTTTTKKKFQVERFIINNRY